MYDEANLADKSPDAIRHEIEETRSALTQKLGTLEHKVKETVQTARCAVVDTVDTVKQTVEDTVEAMKGMVQGTVESVRHTLDLRCQVNQHPWTMMTGAVAVGYTLGMLTSREDRLSRAMSRSPQPTFEPPAISRIDTPPSSGREVDGFFRETRERFRPEINKLNALATGFLCSLVRDMVKQAAPESLAPQLEDLANRITRKLGGEPIEGAVLSPSATSFSSQPIR
jgi:ElaB/YqjD/DUF883 family membrane-anchored ribosome-binding protein